MELRILELGEEWGVIAKSYDGQILPFSLFILGLSFYLIIYLSNDEAGCFRSQPKVEIHDITDDYRIGLHTTNMKMSNILT